MSLVKQQEGSDGEAPVNPYSLLEAVNATSASVHTGWVIFVAAVGYVLVAVAGITHRDLVIAGEIFLPVLRVGIELTHFFLFAPVVLLFLHAGFLTRLVLLARKTFELDAALRILEATDRRTHPLRLELNSFFFVQAIAGPERSRVVGSLLWLLASGTVVLLPLLSILYIQLVFLPYHDVTITWIHRLVVLADVGLLALTAVFLGAPEPSFTRAMGVTLGRRPITALLVVVLLGGISVVSLLLATIPGERLDRIGHTKTDDDPEGRVGRLDGASGDKLLGLFDRNLNVADQTLVIDRDVISGERTLNLRHRDLRHARFDRTSLRQADLTGANLDGASLVAADLRGAVMQCTDADAPESADTLAARRCVSARGATFAKARLAGANLAGADLSGARLVAADLEDVTLRGALLVGADLSRARLDKADLSGGAVLQGANLRAALLPGADLTGAKLEGADLTKASMQAASLSLARLDGAILREADLEAANLYQARLPLADLTGARIRATSLREAWVWRASVPDAADSSLADLASLRAHSPTPDDLEASSKTLKGLAERPLTRGSGARLARMASGDTGPMAERANETAAAWAELIRVSERASSEAGTVIGSLVPTGSFAGVDPPAAPATGSGLAAQLRLSDRRAQITRHLVSMACHPRGGNGAVATGVARRAQGAAFNGDPGAVLETLRRPECSPARAVSPHQLDRLTDAVEMLRRK
jgi:uncharacterized protein YjbI with pentapeptide repeats